MKCQAVQHCSGYAEQLIGDKCSAIVDQIDRDSYSSTRRAPDRPGRIPAMPTTNATSSTAPRRSPGRSHPGRGGSVSVSRSDIAVSRARRGQEDVPGGFGICGSGPSRGWHAQTVAGSRDRHPGRLRPAAAYSEGAERNSLLRGSQLLGSHHDCAVHPRPARRGGRRGPSAPQMPDQPAGPARAGSRPPSDRCCADSPGLDVGRHAPGHAVRYCQRKTAGPALSCQSGARLGTCWERRRPHTSWTGNGTALTCPNRPRTIKGSGLQTASPNNARTALTIG